jgi:methanethiol S-methyltransferase
LSLCNRAPLYLGWLLVFWSAPKMTIAHLLFALATTGYILIAIQFEEKGLTQLCGNEYQQYRKRVSMILPWRSRENHPSAVAMEENTKTAV